MSMELQSGTATNLVVNVNNLLTWAGAQSTNFTGLTSNWQTYTMQLNAVAAGQFSVYLGYVSGTGFTQTSGTILLRNLQFFVPVSSASITAPLTTGSITSSATVTAVSFTSTSDRSIKENIQDANLDTIQGVFDAIEVKQYERTDVSGKRIGFIANDFAAALPEEYGNIVQMTYDSGNPLFSLDYSRINCILYGVCKNQQAALAALTARVAALESA